RDQVAVGLGVVLGEEQQVLELVEVELAVGQCLVRKLVVGEVDELHGDALGGGELGELVPVVLGGGDHADADRVVAAAGRGLGRTVAAARGERQGAGGKQGGEGGGLDAGGHADGSFGQGRHGWSAGGGRLGRGHGGMRARCAR